MAATHQIDLHVKILTLPSFTHQRMVREMRKVYEPHGILVDVVSLETLQLPELVDINVGACSRGALTSDQFALFGNRSSVPVGGIIIYFTRTVFSPGLGFINACAAHVDGAPSAVIAQLASQWSLAHEVGHLLGLPHVNGTDQLMASSGTENFGDSIPILTSSEANRMRMSPFIKPFSST